MKIIIYTLVAFGLGMSVGHVDNIKELKRPLAVKIASIIIYFVLLFFLAKLLLR